ncbi:MAG: tetratricopeptide repeat protein [Gammaproteobacteria bacterium]|nr:tetratricopeptide repeat protein [Gammaproteobacteria bacterium]
MAQVAAVPDERRVVAADSVTSYVNVRLEPNVRSEIIGWLVTDESLPLLGEAGRWYKVQLTSELTGYVHSEWSRAVSAAEAPQPKSAAASRSDTADASRSGTTVAGEAKRDREPLVRPARLIEQRRPLEAYELLAAIEVEWAGDTGYDYLYGLAALDSGHPGEAIFALERVVKLLPDFSGARLELARALFDIGDHAQAKKEFAKLLEQDPPAEVRNIIAAFLDIINNPPAPEERSPSMYYVMAAGGYDTNANGAADLDTFQGFTLDPRSTEQDSSFAEVAIGGMTFRPLSSGLNLLLGADARTRINPDARFVDNTFVSGNAALAFASGVNEFTTGLGATWSEIDGSFNERAWSLNLGWTRPLGEERALRLTVGAGPAEYASALAARDLDMRLLYSLTMRQPLAEEAGEIDWSLIGGRDLASDRATPYTNKRYGARVGGRRNVQGNDIYWGVGAMKVPYGDVPFFDINRDDTQYTANFAIELANRPATGWVLVPNLMYVRNKSNVAIYDNERIQIGLQIRMVR